MGNDNASPYSSVIYDEHIVHVLPFYREFHEQIMDLVKVVRPGAVDWLDTGCGTGTLAARVLDQRDGVRFTLADPSEKMLNTAKRKLEGRGVRFELLASHELPFTSEFDVVTAVQSHHYYRPEEREQAVRRCCRALRDGGVFITFENVRMSSEDSDAAAMKRWISFLREQGNPEEEIRLQIDRRGVETHPITAEEHLDLLRRCGFRSADILWASYLQAGFWAVR